MDGYTGHLGEFEMIVLLAVLQAGDDAYGVTIKQEIERRTQRTVSRGAVYITLERLERKGLVHSHHGAPTAVRGGRSKRLFQVSPHAVGALRRSLGDILRMRDGLQPQVGDV